MDEGIAAGIVRLCFGSKRLWRAQCNLEANGYADHSEWLADWQGSRSSEFFVLGSGDETAGCQLCVATVADNGSLTLRVRMQDCLAQGHGKYVTIDNVRFEYGHERNLNAAVNLRNLLTLPSGRRVTLRDGKALAAGSLCRETGPGGRRTATSKHVFGTADCVLADREILNVNTP